MASQHEREDERWAQFFASAMQGLIVAGEKRFLGGSPRLEQMDELVLDAALLADAMVKRWRQKQPPDL